MADRHSASCLFLRLLSHVACAWQVHLKQESSLDKKGGTWVPLAADNPAAGDMGPQHSAPFQADNLPSGVDGLVDSP